jgi:ATP-dependent protease ClpP protease subunit
MSTGDSSIVEKESTSIHVNESTNEIHFNSVIGQTSITKLITELLNLQSKLLKKKKKLLEKLKDVENDDDSTSVEYNVCVKPIKLFITSSGGSLFQVFSVMDTITSMKVPVYTISKGYVASAGTLLALAGVRRFMTVNSFMLIHELRSGTWGKYSNMVESVENSKMLMEHIKSIYLKNTNLSTTDLEEQLKKDQLWDADTCIKYGLVEGIYDNNKN